jgi:hypothetical protein
MVQLIGPMDEEAKQVMQCVSSMKKVTDRLFT